MNKNLPIITLCLLIHSNALFTSQENNNSLRSASLCESKLPQKPTATPSCWTRFFCGLTPQLDTLSIDPEVARQQAFKKRAAAQESYKPKSLISRLCCLKKTPEKAAEKGIKHQLNVNNITDSYYEHGPITLKSKIKLNDRQRYLTLTGLSQNKDNHKIVQGAAEEEEDDSSEEENTSTLYLDCIAISDSDND